MLAIIVNKINIFLSFSDNFASANEYSLQNDIVTSTSLDGKTESIACEENSSSKKILYALLVANGRSLPEEMLEKIRFIKISSR